MPISAADAEFIRQHGWRAYIDATDWTPEERAERTKVGLRQEAERDSARAIVAAQERIIAAERDAILRARATEAASRRNAINRHVVLVRLSQQFELAVARKEEALRRSCLAAQLSMPIAKSSLSHAGPLSGWEVWHPPVCGGVTSLQSIDWTPFHEMRTVPVKAWSPYV